MKNINEFINYFKFNKIKDKLLNEIKKYNYVEIISIYKKSENYISIQWYGISYDDYIMFLKLNNWPINFIEYIENNQNDLLHIRREITINYKIINDELIIDRTSIYGSV